MRPRRRSSSALEVSRCCATCSSSHGPGRTRTAFPAERGELVPEIRADIGVAQCRPGGTWSVTPTSSELDAERLVSEIGAEPVEADACERPRGEPGLAGAQVLLCLLEASDVGGRLLVRIARALACVEAVQPTTDRCEPCPAGRALELRKGGCERAMLRSVQGPGDVSRARGEVELVGGAGIRVTQQARAHLLQDPRGTRSPPGRTCRTACGTRPGRTPR